MNNGRIWTIVNPNVGVPLFFVGLFLTSLYIHYQVMVQTEWWPKILNGVPF